MPRDPHADTLQVACFRVGPVEYAVDVLGIKEIINPVPITAVPGAPALVEGLVELRGAFLPLVDLRRLLAGAGEATIGKLIIARLGELRVALGVSDVSEVDRLPRAEIQAPPEMGGRVAPAHIVGLINRKGRVLLLIDFGRLFGAGALGELAGVAGAPPG